MTMGETGKPWTGDEVRASVTKYFDMLEMDVQGKHFVKAAIYRELSERFKSRNVNSIERKMSNISAVLVGLGYPHLRGLSPLANYQRSLVESVLGELTRRKSLDAVLEAALLDSVPLGPVDIVREAGAPPEIITDLLHGQGMARPFRRDYLALEAANRALGLAGELAVARREQSYLHSIGRTQLADRVEHVAQTRGDGLGYDVLSFDRKGRESGSKSRRRSMQLMCPSSSHGGSFGCRAPRRSSTTYIAYSDSGQLGGPAYTDSKETCKNLAGWMQFLTRQRQGNGGAPLLSKGRILAANQSLFFVSDSTPSARKERGRQVSVTKHRSRPDVIRELSRRCMRRART
jgi:hypothetical protein